MTPADGRANGTWRLWAMEEVRRARPEVLGEVSDRWFAAQRAAKPAMLAYQEAWAEVPRRDRLARRLGREWFRAAERVLWFGRLGFQTAEDVAYSHLRMLPDDHCPKSAPADVRRMISAAASPALAARPPSPGHWLAGDR